MTRHLTCVAAQDQVPTDEDFHPNSREYDWRHHGFIEKELFLALPALSQQCSRQPVVVSCGWMQ